MDVDGTIFNKRMRQLSDERNLPVAKMARMVGIPTTTMATYLKNREPKFEILVKNV